MCDGNPPAIHPTSPTSSNDTPAVMSEHQEFCALQAVTDDDHGEWCVSDPIGRELSALTGLGPVGITVDVAAPYLQGRSSHAVASRGSDQRYVRLLMERHVAGRYERYDLYLTPGAAVVLASYQAAASLGVAGFTGSDIRPR